MLSFLANYLNGMREKKNKKIKPKWFVGTRYRLLLQFWGGRAQKREQKIAFFIVEGGILYTSKLQQIFVFHPFNPSVTLFTTRAAF